MARHATATARTTSVAFTVELRLSAPPIAAAVHAILALQGSLAVRTLRALEGALTHFGLILRISFKSIVLPAPHSAATLEILLANLALSQSSALLCLEVRVSSSAVARLGESWARAIESPFAVIIAKAFASLNVVFVSELADTSGAGEIAPVPASGIGSRSASLTSGGVVQRGSTNTLGHIAVHLAEQAIHAELVLNSLDAIVSLAARFSKPLRFLKALARVTSE